MAMAGVVGGEGVGVPGAAREDAANVEAKALQVIVLGSGGGPMEFNTTSFLVRSIATGWGKGSIVALDAGVHLSAITRILSETLPTDLGQSDAHPLPYTITTGPFAGLQVPNSNVAANAAHIQSTLIDTYLITHPHLDHIAGFVVNTAGLPGTRPKRLAGLPSTIAAFKTHIFNNVIWPNLSDENNGAGLVTYMRLVEGGSPALGDGEDRGFLEISDGLAVKIWGVSHGHCIERHSHRGSGASTRYGSIDASSSTFGPHATGMGAAAGVMSPRIVAQHNATTASLSAYFPQAGAASSSSSTNAGVAGNTTGARASMSVAGTPSPSESICVYDSSAYFIRDVATGREVLMFGDVEPDSVSLSPRNALIWSEAAPKIAAGKLAAIFIECSYDDSQSIDRLFGHMTPRFIIEELSALAIDVQAARAVTAREAREGKKRKREGEENGGSGSSILEGRRRTAPRVSSGFSDDPVSPKTVKPPRHGSSAGLEGIETPHLATPTAELSIREAELSDAAAVNRMGPPLKGLTVVIIHVKERLRDGPSAGETILSELLAHEENAQLGCEFVISYPGQSLMF